MNDIVRITQALDYAAKKHTDQRRKGVRQEPYLNHLAEVARLAAEATEGKDADLIIACLLHDAIEDQKVPYEEIRAAFGLDVAELVQEVTDDKSLPKAERKRLQVELAPHKSPRAKMIKIADKVSNLRSMIESPPGHWDETRRRTYFAWARDVVAGCRGASPVLEQAFDREYERARTLGLL